MPTDLEQLRAYVEYLHDLGVYDFYRRGEADAESEIARAASQLREAVGRVDAPAAVVRSDAVNTPIVQARGTEAVAVAGRSAPSRVTAPAAMAARAPEPTEEQRALETPIGKLIPFDELAPLPQVRLAAETKPDALEAVRARIGDCTRCPLAYAGRHTIVFGDGDPNAALMFVGEGPGADEDVTGLPFVGKAGQLLNNMIAAMGLRREQVYVANVVKCRPPGNRTPEPAEANTCTQFLVEQIDIVQPRVVVALGLTAAMYLLGARQSLGSLRGRWHQVRGAKLAVTYHPAFLLRDPRQKAEAWKDLQMVMAELKLKSPAAKS